MTHLRLRAEFEIIRSKPYFEILCDKTISSRLRNLIITEAPIEFFSVLTQLARHSINGSLCCKKTFIQRYKKSLILLSDPSTSTSDKKLIISFETPELVSELFSSCITRLQNDSN